MVHHVVHLPPQRVSPGLTFEVHVTYDCDEPFASQITDEHALLKFDLRPACSHGAAARKVAGLKHGLWRDTLPALQPNPLGPHDVQQRIADRGIAAAEILGELLWTQAGGSVKHAAVGPGVVSIQPLERWHIKHGSAVTGALRLILANPPMSSQCRSSCRPRWR